MTNTINATPVTSTTRATMLSDAMVFTIGRDVWMVVERMPGMLLCSRKGSKDSFAVYERLDFAGTAWMVKRHSGTETRARVEFKKGDLLFRLGYRFLAGFFRESWKTIRDQREQKITRFSNDSHVFVHLHDHLESRLGELSDKGYSTFVECDNIGEMAGFVGGIIAKRRGMPIQRQKPAAPADRGQKLEHQGAETPATDRRGAACQN